MTGLNSPSFRLLLKLEWLVLATALVMELALPFHGFWLSLLSGGTIALFSLIGLRLPTGQLSHKTLYTSLEFILILLPATQGILSSRSVFLLCLVVLMRSCLIFRRSGQLVVLALALISYITLLLSKPILTERINRVAAVWDWRFSNILLYSLTLIFALLLISALIAEHQSREQLEQVYQELENTHAQLRQYALRVEDQATLQERSRIARDIHDGLGHTLAAQVIQINNALLFWHSDHDKALTALKHAKQLGGDALLEVRKSVSVLRSSPLQGKSLGNAIETLLQDFQSATGMTIAKTIHLPATLPTDVNTTLYRVVQESLTNIHKHAQAKTVVVGLQPQMGTIQLKIEDDGKGFNPTQNTTGFGLQGMRERVTALRGHFSLESQPGQGCHVLVSLPLTELPL